jgi:peptidylprolyl isomerase
MTTAKQGDTVAIHYSGTLADGREFDSSAGRDPLRFAIGEGSVLPGFEAQIVGMSVEESKTFTLAAIDAYGPRNEELVNEVPRTALPADLDPEIGQRLQASTPDGQTVALTITEVTPDTISVDGNHPLAGQDLTFAVKLVSVG